MIDDFPRSRRWNAQWVWAPGDGNAKNVYFYFRREFELDGPPEGCRLFIAADTRYALWVNGEFVGRGAPQSQPYFQYYDERDVGELLVGGRNCVAVVANHVGNLPDTRGGLLAELIDGKGETVVGTSPEWRAERAAAWRPNTFSCGSNQVTPYQEWFDARQAPEGWAEAGFDDGGWGRAVAVSGTRAEGITRAMPWTRLVPRDIPFLVQEPRLPTAVESVEECLSIANRTRSEDLSICLSAVGKPVEHSRVENAEGLCSEGGVTVVQCSTDHLDRVSDGIHDPCIVLDFGRVITAYVALDLDGVAGGMVDIGYAERLIDGRFDLCLQVIEERWGRRMLDCGARSTFEEWYQNGSWRSGQFAGFLRTHSHAWSGHPAEFLIRNLIGLDILEPGCRKVRLCPKDVPFDYDAVFPTPLGPIEVTKRGRDVKVSVPEGVDRI